MLNCRFDAEVVVASVGEVAYPVGIEVREIPWNTRIVEELDGAQSEVEVHDEMTQQERIHGAQPVEQRDYDMEHVEEEEAFHTSDAMVEEFGQMEEGLVLRTSGEDEGCPSCYCCEEIAVAWQAILNFPCWTKLA